MEQDRIGDILSAIGAVLISEDGFSKKGTLLFADVERGAISLSIFYERPKEIVYLQPKYRKYQTLIFELWELMEREHEWRELHFLMREKEFKATFRYADEVDEEESMSDQRDLAVQLHLGEKPVYYPPWKPSDFAEL